MAQQPTYLLAPNFTFKPRGGPIALGNIIADPFRPHRVLTTIDEAARAARYPRIETFAELDRTIARGSGHDVAVAVWAQFLQGVGASLSGDRAVEKSTEYTMDKLETEYFVQDPGQAEIEARVKEQKVRGVMAGTVGHRQPVYMITALKIAKGFSASTTTGKRKGVGVEAGIPVAEGITTGANMSGGVEASSSDSWRAGEDIIFAYQLLKIELKGWRTKRVEVDEFRSNAAFLDTRDKPDELDEEDDDEDGGSDVEVAATAATIQDLEAADEDKLATSTVAGTPGSQVHVIRFPGDN
ncbi:hypothetical protein NW752_003169 [Fusarium irregulare]|uniref:Uncharacterized protein n=1 Tax=Fusarium irregulare TaxID=2494466 RepID=A0A9W8Q2E1_9HYPO|nr:hypothetical protein NW766_000844 [Fusarium irregulare]KAJ4025694.1 hypothetical protein NW752_003169 [Fusarium irregulare]